MRTNFCQDGTNAQHPARSAARGHSFETGQTAGPGPALSFHADPIPYRARTGRPLGEIFPYFDPEPLAAASIGQVHRARLYTGEEVVVKVQRPGIEGIIADDMEILYTVAQLAEKRTA
ncbi:MAG: hypothetical protein IMW95_10870 [Moorella humiferrea]|nr:hypothetical protein [Moorella humiferrea]